MKKWKWGLSLGAAAFTFPTAAFAADPTVKDAIQAIDAVWVLVAALLVFFMQAGFALLEAGVTRMKNTGHIAGKNVLSFAIATLVIWAVAHGLHETHTAARITHLMERKLWRVEDGNEILEAYGTLLRLRLWNNYARPDALPEREREALQSALRTVKSLQKRTAKEFSKPK